MVSRQSALYPSLECALHNKLLLFETGLSLSLDLILSFKKTRTGKHHAFCLEQREEGGSKGESWGQVYS